MAWKHAFTRVKGLTPHPHKPKYCSKRLNTHPPKAKYSGKRAYNPPTSTNFDTETDVPSSVFSPVSYF